MWAEPECMKSSFVGVNTVLTIHDVHSAIASVLHTLLIGASLTFSPVLYFVIDFGQNLNVVTPSEIIHIPVLSVAGSSELIRQPVRSKFSNG